MKPRSAPENSIANARRARRPASPEVHQPTYRETALEALRAGLCVLPPTGKGSKKDPKAPLGEWKQYQTEPTSLDQVESWYSNGRTTLGCVTGKVSGNLEVLDFDNRETYELFVARASEVGLAELVVRVEAGYCEDTPNGVHWLWRCDPVEGGKKLAGRPMPDGKVKTLIETKGEGGFIILAPTTGLHDNGRSYVLRSGGFATIATISPEEREELLDLALSFDQVGDAYEPPAAEAPQNVRGQIIARDTGGATWDLKPIDDFKERASWSEILEPAGWSRVYEREGETFWRRPGKNQGVSATSGIRPCGADLLYVFTTSSQLVSRKPLNKFDAFAKLFHNGETLDAVEDLKARGYGKESASRPAGKPAPGVATQTAVDVDWDALSDEDLGIRHAKDVVERPILWLWKYRLAQGKLTLLAGDGGNGKSQFALAAAAAITTGGALPSGEAVPRPGRVVIVSAEDQAEDTVRPRLRALGADLDRITFLKPQLVIRKPGKEPLVDPQSFKDAPYWREVFRRLPDTALLIVDTLPSYLGRGVNDSKNTEVRQVLEPFLENVLEPTGVACLGIVHLNKGADARTPAHRILGSVAYSNLARAVYFVARDPEDPARCLFAMAKCNLAPHDVPAIGFRIERRELVSASGELVETSMPVFESEPVILSLSEIVSGKPRTSQPDDKRKAAEWLRARLADGPVGSCVCARDGDQALGKPWNLERFAEEDRRKFILGRVKFWREKILNDRLQGKAAKHGKSGPWFFRLEDTDAAATWPPSMDAIAEAGMVEPRNETPEERPQSIHCCHS